MTKRQLTAYVIKQIEEMISCIESDEDMKEVIKYIFCNYLAGGITYRRAQILTGYAKQWNLGFILDHDIKE